MRQQEEIWAGVHAYTPSRHSRLEDTVILYSAEQPFDSLDGMTRHDLTKW